MSPSNLDSQFLRLLDRYRGDRDDPDSPARPGQERTRRELRERYWAPPELGPFDGLPDRVDLDDAWEWLEKYGDTEWGRQRASERYHFRIDSIGGGVHFIEISPLLGLLRIHIDPQNAGGSGEGVAVYVPDGDPGRRTIRNLIRVDE